MQKDHPRTKRHFCTFNKESSVTCLIFCSLLVYVTMFCASFPTTPGKRLFESEFHSRMFMHVTDGSKIVSLVPTAIAMLIHEIYLHQ